MTTAATFSRTDLTRKTREILDLVQRGQPARIESYRKEQAVLLDPLEYRLLRGLAALGSGRDGSEGELQRLQRRYLDEEISLSKMAHTLGVSRLELMDASSGSASPSGSARPAWKRPERSSGRRGASSDGPRRGRHHGLELLPSPSETRKAERSVCCPAWWPSGLFSRSRRTVSSQR